MLSAGPTLLPFVLFALVASITPGPTNLLVLSNSARYGLKAALPIIFGACASAAALVLVVGYGFGQALTRLPQVQGVMQGVGIVWLSYLAWQIFSAPAEAVTTEIEQRRLGWLGAASLQLVNPKTWMMALAVVSVFAVNGNEGQGRVLTLSLVFFLVSLPCLGVWALLGVGSARLFRSPQAMQRFNRAMALLLLLSAWMSLRA